MAGLLLGDYNILVLDEPGNHLDVETVESLASALEAYKGTVIFTSHDRHFMKRIATSVVEVRDGTVKNYLGDYDAYVYSINKEIEEGERATKNAKSASGPPPAKFSKGAGAEKALTQNEQRALRKKIKAIERKIAKLDDEKKALSAELLTATDPAEAVRLHNEVTAISEQLEAAEEEWLELSQ